MSKIDLAQQAWHLEKQISDRSAIVVQEHAENLADPYYQRVSLPRILGYRKLDKEAQLTSFASTVQNQHAQSPQFANTVNS